jgi:hypothetical protein
MIFFAVVAALAVSLTVSCTRNSSQTETTPVADSANVANDSCALANDSCAADSVSTK